MAQEAQLHLTAPVGDRNCSAQDPDGGSACLQEEFAKAMQGIVCDSDKRVIDEAPQAYKDLTKVMANQASLTEVVHRLKPLVNVKGF